MGRGPIALRRSGLYLLLTAALVTVADQVSKAMVRAYVGPSRSIPLIPGILEISHVRNTGAAFGLMPGQRPLFIATTFLVLAGIVYVWFHYRPREWYVVLALGLVVGGAVGNLIDRVLVGRVTDFLYVHFWPVFNVADSAVVVGVGVLVVWLLFHPEDDEHETAEGRGEA